MFIQHVHRHNSNVLIPVDAYLPTSDAMEPSATVMTVVTSGTALSSPLSSVVYNCILKMHVIRVF